MLINWNYIQNLRNSDPLWLLKGVSPWLYMLIIVYILLFFVIVHCDLKGKLFHLTFISQLVLVIDSTPYFLSTLCRFPDTFGTVEDSLLFLKIFSGSIWRQYPQSYPISYILFYITHSLANIDLFLFSRYIFSPLILLGIFIMWYLFAVRLFGSRIALISTIIAIPTQMIEISLTPNSVGIILVLISLFLCVSNKWNFRISFLIVETALILSHPINPLVFFIILLLCYFFMNLTKLTILDIDKNKILQYLFILSAWLSTHYCSLGKAMIKSFYNILMMKNKHVEQVSIYTTGSGNLAVYPWIQNFAMYKYELYGLVIVILVIFDFYFLNLYTFKLSKIRALKESNFSIKYFCLILSLILFFITFYLLAFGGSDIQNIISRTLNYSMLFISIFMAISYNSLNTQFKFSLKFIKIIFFVLLLLVFITYPLYSYGRDSYINYPASVKVGHDFLENHSFNDNLKIIAYSKSTYFHQLMHNISSKNDDLMRSHMSQIYVNGWYSLYSN